MAGGFSSLAPDRCITRNRPRAETARRIRVFTCQVFPETARTRVGARSRDLAQDRGELSAAGRLRESQRVEDTTGTTGNTPCHRDCRHRWAQDAESRGQADRQGDGDREEAPKEDCWQASHCFRSHRSRHGEREKAERPIKRHGKAARLSGDRHPDLSPNQWIGDVRRFATGRWSPSLCRANGYRALANVQAARGPMNGAVAKQQA